MIKVEENFSLKSLNTFGVSAFAKAYIKSTSLDQLREAIAFCNSDNIFLLGGGSNMLIKNDIQRTVIHVDLKGKEVVNRENGKILLKVMAGENWHELVLYCLDQNYAGLENLSLIPGNVGTAPIQNIGAYGVELKDTFHSCEVLEIATLKTKTLTKAQCNFGYRDSIFKNEASGKYVITSVIFDLIDLNVTDNYDLKLKYGAIQDEMDRLDGEASIKKVSKAVINIRSNKLPDPKNLGNSGSFFKNPVIPKTQFLQLQQSHSDMPSYPVDDDHVKVPAGWLIEQSGLKGKRFGDAGIHDRQALVLVNYGNASGEEILEVARKVQKIVHEKFGIKIEMEVNLIDH